MAPDLRVVASPWTPPVWMKTSAAGSTTPSHYGGGLAPAAYAPYAQYFVKFLRAYADAGVPIEAITVQNEPHFEPVDYPGMRLEANESAAFVGGFLGPALAMSSLRTRILVWDHNWDEPDYPLRVLGDSHANPYIAGTAFHCYAGDARAQSDVHAAYPDREIDVTECSGYRQLDFAAELTHMVRDLLIGATRVWAERVILWNIALDQDDGPRTGGCDSCIPLLTLSGPHNGEPMPTADYYALGQFSKFVRPGAQRIASEATSATISASASDVPNVAFQNPDGSIVVVLMNTSATSQAINVIWHAQQAHAQLPGASVETLVWR